VGGGEADIPNIPQKAEHQLKKSVLIEMCQIIKNVLKNPL